MYSLFPPLEEWWGIIGSGGGGGGEGGFSLPTDVVSLGPAMVNR